MRYALSVLLVLTSVLPLATPASADQTYVNCAVGTSSESAHVVLTMNSVRQQFGVVESAAACSDLIASGWFVGLANDVEWGPRGFQPFCSVQFLTGQEQMDVWAWPEEASRELAFTVCLAYGDEGRPVRYY